MSGRARRWVHVKGIRAAFAVCTFAAESPNSAARMGWFVEPRVGIEPTTVRLQGGCAVAAFVRGMTFRLGACYRFATRIAGRWFSEGRDGTVPAWLR